MSNEIEETLIVQDGSSVSHDDALLDQRPPPKERCTLPSFSDYEALGGVPTRVLKPSDSASNFSCYAFSADGSRLATGEFNGTIRLWRTSDYGLEEEATRLLREDVRSLSFVSGSNTTIIAVGANERVLEFSFIPRSMDFGTSAFETSSGPEILMESRLCHTFSWCDCSKDGCTLLCNVWSESQTLQLYRLMESRLHSTLLKIEGDILRGFVSGNGMSVACVSSANTGSDFDESIVSVIVWPNVESLETDPQSVILEGSRAVWGLNGEYLMIWNARSGWEPNASRGELRDGGLLIGKPQLTVYQTDLLLCRSKANCIVASRELDVGLANWKALMLEDPGNLSVLICEIGKAGMRRFVLWDLIQNAIVKEVTMALQPKGSVDRRQPEHSQTAEDNLRECDLPAPTWNAHQYLTGEDACPRFCQSRDGRWIGAFSWRHHAFSIASTDSGATVWSLALPDKALIDQSYYKTLGIAMFDPSGQHFLLIGNKSILACTPAFLNSKCNQEMVKKKIPKELFLDEMHQNGRLRTLMDILPGQALAHVGTVRMRSGDSEFALKEYYPNPQDAAVKDAVASRNGCWSACIVYDLASEKSLVWTWEIGTPRLPSTSQGIEIKQIPLDTFAPARLFLYEASDDKKHLVIFGVGSKPEAFFCGIDDQESKLVHFDMEAVHSISQTHNLRRVVLLDNTSVCILDLQQRQITEKIPYQVDFGKILDQVKDNTVWTKYRRKNGIDTDFDSDRRLSDNGQAVLLAWDTKNRKSILITPSKKQKECEALILAADGQLSDFCVLTRNAKSTLFVDIEEFQNGRLTVGVFNEAGAQTLRFIEVSFLFVAARVMHWVNVLENLKTQDMYGWQLKFLMSCLYYDLSSDGSELVTLVEPEEDQRLHGDFDLKEQLGVFTLYATTDCIPNYSRLMSRKNIVTANRVNWVFGMCGNGCVFNSSAPTEASIFQKAFMETNREMVNCITALAKEHGFQLAFEWKSSNTEASNLLENSLYEAHSTNEMRDAIALLGSGQIPFDRAADVMKCLFKELLLQHPEIIEDVLLNNALVIEVCQLCVHVDYMNLKLRQDTAVHINTTDTILEWSLDCDPDNLGKMWKAKYAETVGNMEATGNRSTTTASLKSVCIGDAAKVGMNGILRPLLLQGVPEVIFASLVVKWVVLYKWFKIWKPRFIQNAAFYAVFLTFFTAYVIFIGASAEISADSLWRRVVMTSLLVMTFCFGFQMFREEIMQLRTFTKDGLENFGGFFWGVRYFLKSRWNWVDLASCFLLLILMPIFHCLALADSNFEDYLSGIVAVEGVIAFTKVDLSSEEEIECGFQVWYFAQPFRRTGALVLMIDNIAKDCFSFLGLAFVVLFGFASALHVLFRGVSIQDGDAVEEAFGTFQHSLLTLFYALLGTFDPEIYRAAGRLSWLITAVFSAYMSTQMILLLNLLIAIMGDTFDRVKSTEEAQLLMGRAKFIDACEAALSEAEKAEIEREVGTYLHVLVPIDDESGQDSSVQWLGKLIMLEQSFRTNLKKTELHMKEIAEAQEKRMTERMERLEATVEEMNKNTAVHFENILSLLRKYDAASQND